MDLRSGLPFQLIKNGLPFEYPALDRDLSTDVLIIGGGITGALCAYMLSRAGFACVVADTRTIGLGSTCASTSLLQYELDTPLYKLAEKMGYRDAVSSYLTGIEALHGMKALAGEIGLSSYSARPSFQFASFKKHEAPLRKEYEMRKKAGIEVYFLSEDEIRSIFPFSAPAGLMSAEAALADSYMFCHLLHQKSISLGARVYDRTAVLPPVHRKSGIKAKTENGFTVRARWVIYATGYESVKYMKPGLIKLHSTYALAGENMASAEYWYKNCLIWETRRPYLYMAVTHDNRIIAGGRDEPFYNQGRRDRLLKKKARQLAADFGKLFPAIPLKPEYTWCGTFGESKDGLPYIDSSPKFPNGYFAVGTGGNGITFAYIAAQMILDLVMGRKGLRNIYHFDR